MKTKNFLLFSTSVFIISLFLIVFHSQPPQSIQSIVTQTHQHIKDFQESVWVSGGARDGGGGGGSALESEQKARYAALLGLEPAPARWHNTTTPALVTHARGDAHAQAVGFVRDAARLPYTVLLYDLGLKPASLQILSNYCNSSKCAIIEFDLDVFPSHVSDESIHAFRPLIIQHALSRVGGVIFMEACVRWAGSAGGLAALWRRAGAGRAGGVLAWPRRAAVTSLTHPRMFRHLHAAPDDFLFVQMVDASRLVLAASPPAASLMRAWTGCALTLDCIMPIGAQSGGCRFDKKPQYRYSGCHERDASALSILLGLRSGFEEAQYAARAPGDGDAAGEGAWRSVSDDAARRRLALLLRNATEHDTPAPAPPAPPAPAPAAPPTPDQLTPRSDLAPKH